MADCCVAEDQLAYEKKCGHMGGKVLIPVRAFVRILNAARLASDVMGAPTVLIARTDALSAPYVLSDVDEIDQGFITGRRTSEGYFEVKGGVEYAIARSLAYAPYADLLWFEKSRPDLDEARQFAEAIHAHYPGKLLAHNLSPSFNWRKFMSTSSLARFQQDLADLGYRLQFITLAGWHLINCHTFKLARSYAREGLPAYVRLQDMGFEAEEEEMNPSSSGIDNSLHQLESVKRAPETRLTISHRRGEPAHTPALAPRHLISPQKSVVDPAHKCRDAV